MPDELPPQEYPEDPDLQFPDDPDLHRVLACAETLIQNLQRTAKRLEIIPQVRNKTLARQIVRTSEVLTLQLQQLASTPYPMPDELPPQEFPEDPDLQFPDDPDLLRVLARAEPLLQKLQSTVNLLESVPQVRNKTLVRQIVVTSEVLALLLKQLRDTMYE